MFKDYMGDGVYIDGKNLNDFVLTTENGVSITNTIHIDLDMIKRIQRYATVYLPAKVKEERQIKQAEEKQADDFR